MTAPRVVLVDDTEDLRMLMRIALSRAGYEVVGEAGDGAAGIEAVREHAPDLVVLDLSMPVMDGLEALPHIRSTCPGATIVVMSGFGAGQMTERALAGGADGYLQKGASLSSVVAYLDDALARRSAPASTEVPAAATEGEPGAPDLLELAPIAVLEVADDADLVVRYANPAARSLLGDASPGTPLARASADLAAFVEAHRSAAEATQGLVLGELPVRATLRRGTDSLAIYLDAGAGDVEALHRAIATTAHELRGPVAVICGAAETLEIAGELEPALVVQLSGSMARQARILDGLTAELLTAAQARRGALLIQVREVDPADVVRAVVELQYDAEVLVEDDRLVRADPQRLEQMVANLLSNARKHGRAPVVVTIRPAGERVAIDVSDAGDGVPEDFRRRLFAEYARARPDAAPGIGLGLHVVRTLAEAQGGSAAYSPASGGGSVFTIELPAA